ncbi:GNAT family N-acetyltransferase [Novosphingobium piscinae]|uniref:GNAT family N-acetyltransferase n=2 Tax=Novosphingobium piscinae TaxID=1507448 RepID=A0A7X1FWD2_9SPHN|nr:GNAT family N-acetyltransferase [Novosphingobium piscinae]
MAVARAEASGPAARRQWERLVASAAEPNPFFEPWYLLPSLAALDPGGRVTLLVIERAGEWLGLLPLALERRYYGHPLPHWRGWLHANAFVGLPLIARGHEAEVWTALLAHLDRTAGTGLFLHLAGLPLASPVCAALAAVCAAQGRQAALVHREERALLQSASSPADYLDGALSGKKRKELRRQHARLSELGELAITRQRDAVGIEGWIAAFLALEQAGWKGRAGSALASHPATRSLFELALREAAMQGRLERLTLALDGVPIALLATFLAAPGAFSYKTAFDERYARYSPGVLLQRENLALLDDPQIAWCDSCAAEDHPMIDHLWRERRAIGRLSIAIGGRLRRGAFRLLARAEGGTTAPGPSLEGGMAPAGDPA